MSEQETVQEVVAESPEMTKYFSQIKTETQRCHDIAKVSRAKGYDPSTDVEVPLAEDMAERVEGLISIVAPQLVGKGVIERIKELEETYGRLAWEVALLIAEEVAKEKFCTFKDKVEAMEVGIRTGFAYNTLGIVSAPLEGFIELRIKKTQDGKEYFAPTYAGPIRGAGGTAASFSVIIADYVRTKMGYARYDPTEEEIKRYITEVQDYHERVTNLQYFPSEEELQFMLKNLPVQVDGEPTEKIDVSNYKDLSRVDTNKIRGGIALVIGEGLTQKSKKLWKRIQKFGKDFGMEWDFLEEFLKIQKKVRSKQGEEKKEEKKEDKPKVVPDFNFIKDLVAGRPVLAYPMKAGGLRLRYGRTRLTGFSSAAAHPYTLGLLFDYIATGTQLRLERPGKACSITPADSVDPPVVLLESGEVLQITSDDELKRAKKNLKEILYLGDILISFGDFSENGHPLVPAGYCQEWWYLELKQAVAKQLGEWNRDKISENYGIDRALLEKLESNAIRTKIPVATAFSLAKKLDMPLHPDHTYYWKLLKPSQLLSVITALEAGEVTEKEHLVSKIILKNAEEVKEALEILAIPHNPVSKDHLVVEGEGAHALFHSLSMADSAALSQLKESLSQEGIDCLDAMNAVLPITLRDKAGIFIGARMGRPEKAKMRKMKGSPHCLFPVGWEGGRMRSFNSSLDAGKINADFPLYKCTGCSAESVYAVCHLCGSKCDQKFFDMDRGNLVIDKRKEEGCRAYSNRSIEIRKYWDSAKKISGYRPSEGTVIKGVRGTSNEDHLPEHLVKGLLRAKHNIFVNKDGTTRYDMSELPITHFIPAEIGTPIEKLKDLGYLVDIDGKPLENDHQVLEMKPQDLILPGFTNFAERACDDVLMCVANFIDDLLVRLYGQEPFYNVKTKTDLVGHLCIGLAPHISAGMVGRIIGFSQTQGMFTHPLYHAGLRRDCDGDEACVMLLLDAFLNFSRQFLPNRRGAKTMDAPLVLTSKLLPSEVDDQVHGLDIVDEYPLELYEAALECKPTWDIHVEQIKHKLDTPGQYEGMKYTHSLPSMNMGILCSAYKTLESMKEKLDGQMRIAEIIKAVEEARVAELVIEKHFIKDIKGNLRKFSTQQYNCVGCNTSYRRLPLVGKCTECGGKINFTVSQGSIVKYLEPSIKLVEEYAVTPYLKQVIELTRRRIEDVFGREKEKQLGLGSFC